MRYLQFGFLVLAAVTTVTCGGDKLTLPDEGNPSSALVEKGNNQTGTVARPLADSLILRLTDSKSRPVSGQRVAFVITGGTAGADVVPDTAISDDAGRVAARWILGTTAGTQTLEARVIGFSSLTKTFTAQATPAAADTIRLIQGDGQSGTVGALLTDSLVVRVTDQFGNGVPGITVAWSVTGGGSVAPATTTTDATGRAATARTLGSSAGLQSAVASVAGLKGSPVTFTQTAGSGSASSLTIQSGNNQSGPASFPLGMPLVVKLADANGNGVPGVTVTWVVATGGGSVAPPTATTDPNGLASTNWTLGPVAGANTLNAVSSGFTVNFSATATAAAPTQMAANSATSQNGTAGLAAPTSPSVRVRDANGNGVAGVGVTFAVTAGGGSVSDTTVGTNASGVATLPTWTLGQVAGANQLTASVTPALIGSPVTFNATGNPGPAAQMVMSTQPPASMTSGATISPTPVVQLQDQFGNNATTQNVSVTVGLTGAGTLSGTKTRTSNSSGQAVFPNLTLSGPAGIYSLAFTATGLTGVTSSSITLGAGAPAQLAITTQPSASVVNGQPFAQQPVIQVQDAVGNPVAQSGIAVTAAITAPGTGTLGGTTTVSTDAAGMAAFTNLAITGSTGTRTLTFTASGLGSATSSGVTLGAGAATQIAVNGGNNQSAPAGSAVSTAPSAVVRDAQNNPVAGVSVTFQVASGGGSLAGGSPQVVVTNGSGVAQSSAWTLGPTAGTNTLTATATGLSGSPVTFTATATVGAPANIAKSGGDNLTGPIGTTLGTPHEVLITDANGNGVPNVTVTWTTGGGGSVSPVTSQTDSAGHATATRTLGNTAGTQTTTATATIGGSPTSVTFTITATNGGASQMALNGGDNQTGTVATTLPTPLSVVVKDVGNNGVPGVTVTWTVISGGGSVTSSSVTNASGIAGASWTLGTGAGVQAARATAVGSPVNFIATGIPGPVSASVSSLIIAPSSIAASSGSGPSTATVTARDQYGNPIQGATVVLGVTGTGNTINQPALTGSNGVTTGTVSSTVAESKTVSASANGTTLTTTRTLTVSPAAAAQLTVSQQPGSAQSGQGITPAPSFTIRDVFGNQVTSATNGVTLGILNNPGGGILSGTTVVSASGGVATFPGMSIDKAGTGYTLQATATGLVSANTGPFDITAGAPSASTSTVSASPGAITASSGSSTSTITVTVRDGAGNPIPGVNVALAATGTGNTLAAPGTTNASGVFTGTLSSTKAESKTVSATAGGVGITQTAGVTVNPGPASQLAVVQQPGAGQAGQALSPAPAFAIRDAFGNQVTGATNMVAVSIGTNPGGGTLSGTTTLSASGGVATFPGLSIDKAGTGYTLQADAAGLSSAVTGPFNLTAGTPSAATSTVSASPGTITASSGSSTSTITVTVRDAGGNPVPGVSVSLASTGTANTLSAPGTTNGSGVYTGTISSTRAESKTVSATAGGVGITQTAGVTVNPGAPSQLAVSQQPGSAQSGQAISPAPAFRVLDAFGNQVTSATSQVDIAIGANPGSGTLSGATTVNASGGVATFPGLSIDNAGTGYTLQATSTGLAGATTATFDITAAAPSASMSTVSASPGTITASSGSSTSTITVTVKDAAGNPVPGVSVSLASTGTANTLSAPGTTNGSGVYTGTISSTKAESKTVSATAGGVGITQTAGVTVNPGAPSASQSLASVPATGTAGTPTPVSVQARDAFGNTVTTGGATVVVSVTGANTTSPAVSDNGDGTYTTSYTPTATGADNVAITLGGSPVGASPFVTTVGAGPPSASTSTVSASPGTITASSGSSTSTITVTVKDAAGNPVSGVSVTLASTGSGNSLSAAGTTDGAGVYTGTISSTVAEPKTVSASAGGVGITQTAGVTVQPGAASAGQTTATVPGGNTGVPTNIVVQARDQFGNPLTAGSDIVTVDVSGTNPAGSLTVTDNGDGTYSASYTPGSAGTDTVDVTINGNAISGSPYTSTVN